MAILEISETQIAFGYLHSYLNVHKPTKFMIPSIRQEGGTAAFPYPGADIILNNNHLIQFKRPFYFKTNGVKEFWNYSKPVDINPPYFRLNIKNDDPTNQLTNLIRATRKGLLAEYISPLYDNETTFFSLLKNDHLHLQAYAHIDIAQFDTMLAAIGNNNDHTILYTDTSVSNGFCYCFSEPKKIEALKINDNTVIPKGQSFDAFELLNIISSIFFENEDIIYQDENILYQCHLLQRKLLLERNIIWQFNYIKKDE